MALFLQQQSQGKTNMKLLRTIVEAVTEKLLDICDGAVDLFEKGCEPLPVEPLERWLTEINVSKINPVVPFGGF